MVMRAELHAAAVSSTFAAATPSFRRWCPRAPSRRWAICCCIATLPNRASGAFLLWPDSTEAQARTNLRHVLHNLRRTLPDANRYLEVTPRDFAEFAREHAAAFGAA